MADPDHSLLRRRTLLRSAGGGAVAASLLAACGSEDEPAAPSGSEGEANGGSGGDSGGGSGGNGGGQGGQQLTSTTDVDVGGGVIVEGQYVITQPARGEFKAFSAICTHQGCVVSSVSDNTINCGCHGSAFSAEDGSVVNGPAETPLEEEQIRVEGNKVLLG
ncbi:MAG: putative secreted iron sulfur protein [Nocardioidaceae bacterium]|nr:putative secreted iron sulfur protein [Nocardioidaceae bacterium]